jgi:Zn-dependent protease
MAHVRLEWFFPFLQGLSCGVAAMILHECGHILSAIALGVKVKRVGLKWNKGIYTVREKGSVTKNMMIALAGPLVNLVLISSGRWSPTFALANFCYAIANLLPIDGSDGSRILQCWQGMRKKNLAIG